MISKTAVVAKGVSLGKNVKIWHFTQIREGVNIGNNCIIGKNVYIDCEVKIGSNVKIQNNSLIYSGTVIEDDVFIGPAVCFTNDKYPRATISGKLKKKNDWNLGKIFVKKGASIGANSVIISGLEIGNYAMIGAGSVVTRSVPRYGLVRGNPAKILGFVCKLGHSLNIKVNSKAKDYYCQACKKHY